MKTATIRPLIILSCFFLLTELSLSDTVIFQDFELPSGWNGASPPSSYGPPSEWSIADNGAADGIWDNFDWFRFSAWGGNIARVSGANQNYYNNDWIISQAVDLTSAVTCTLFFRHYYDDIDSWSSDSALVLISTDDGATWDDTAAVYTGIDYGTNTAPDSEYLNISSFVAGEPSVKVAFQYVKRQAVVAGGWRIDDVKFIAGGGEIIHQDFESAWGPFGNSPPSNWSINDINVLLWDDNDWHQSSASGWGNVADVFWSPVEKQNELMVSEAADFSSGTNDIIMSLKQWYDDASDPSDSALIMGSIDDGATWPETLKVYSGTDRGGLTTPAYDTLRNIYDWANNESAVRFGFKYIGVNDGRWFIDSIRVERIDNFNYDAKVAAVLSPSSSTILGYSWPVSATVENFGLNTISFNVTLKIADSTGATIYNHTQAVNSLNALSQRTIDFPSWTANEPNTHTITCFTAFSGDQDHTNDTLIAETYTYPHVGSNGPVEGWSFKDNITGGGPGYQWIDIGSFGNEMGFTDAEDGNSGMIEMGMDFEYFWSHYSRISVSVNGWLSFVDSTSSDNTFSMIPDTDGPAGMIGLLWSNLSLGAGHIYYHYDSDANQFIVQYDSVEFAGIPGTDIGMEVIFDGDDNTIKMQYKYFLGGTDSNTTIGIENQAEDLGLPYNNAGQPGQTAMPGLAVTYQYLLPHDIRIVAINQPTILLHAGVNNEIVAAFKNAGAATETFEVTAYDNFGYSNTQTITNMVSLDSVAVSFPDWHIANECSTYTLTVFANLASDMDRSRDTLSKEYVATPPANVESANDDGAVAQAEYDDGDAVITSEFNILYGDAAISAVAFKFTNDDLPNQNWPDATHDSVNAYIFLDENDDNMPDLLPIYSGKIATVPVGWTIWPVACETTITVNCGKIWAGYANYPQPGYEAICLDSSLDFQNRKWILFEGAWYSDEFVDGDLMIRAYFDANPATAPNLSSGTALVTGAALPHNADTAATYIENTGSSCDLVYSVQVLQTPPVGLSDINSAPNCIKMNAPMASIGIRTIEPPNANDPISPPMTLDAGGPDNYGYTWIDSDEPNGPGFHWIDLTAIGTEVNWDYGNADDGHTDPIQMDMTFSFYGAIYDNIVISSNGWVSFMSVPFDPLGDFSQNGNLPIISEIGTVIAVDWDDLDGGTAGHCYYYHDEAANSFVVSWVNWSHKPAPTAQHSFQVIFNATDGTILYQYGSGTFENDITIGIGNENGDDGLAIAYNEPYLHNDLAVLISPTIFWLWTDLPNGVLPASSGPQPFNIYMYAHDLPTGTYNGAIVLTSNDVDQPVTVIDVQFEIEGICAYIPGDVNSSGAANGIDVTFMVTYFKGGNPPHEECEPCSTIYHGNMLYPQGDVNGNCAWNGIDVTYFVAYLKGIGQPIRYCDNCAPAGGGGFFDSRDANPSLSPALEPQLKIRKANAR